MVPKTPNNPARLISLSSTLAVRAKCPHDSRRGQRRYDLINETPTRTGAPSGRSAGVPPAVAGASRPRFGSVHIHDRGHLPHWEKEGATYFVTFRLASSLPKSVFERIQSEKHALLRTANQLRRPLSFDETKKIQRLSAQIIEHSLDQGAGCCHLQNSAIDDAVAATLRHFDERRYRLFAWCIMPNHVHVVLKTFPGHPLSEIVHSWKSFTEKAANRIMGRRGSFWQREYYDHLVRDQVELERAMRYVAANPEKANLTNWKWVWLCGQDACTTAAKDRGATTS